MATKEQIESELEVLKEKFEYLKGKVDLLEIIVKQPSAPKVEETQIKLVKLKQINVQPKTEIVRDKLPGQKQGPPRTVVVEKGKSYFCKTQEEQQIFAENNPGVKTESFDIQLQPEVAEKYLNDAENKEQFTKKETVNV